MQGRNPMRGFSFQGTKVTVESGKSASTTLTISPGTVSLTVKVSEKAGKTLNFTWITAVRGDVSAATGRELELAIGRQPEGYSAQTMSIANMPASLRELSEGDYTVCGTPYPPEVTGMSATMAYMEREGDQLPTYCHAISVAASPESQNAAIEVTAPDFVPPASE